MPQIVDFIGGAEGGRTPDLSIANAALCQTELLPHKQISILRAVSGGVKPDFPAQNKSENLKFSLNEDFFVMSYFHKQNH